jgi:hypothetical protein
MKFFEITQQNTRRKINKKNFSHIDKIASQQKDLINLRAQLKTKLMIYETIPKGRRIDKNSKTRQRIRKMIDTLKEDIKQIDSKIQKTSKKYPSLNPNGPNALTQKYNKSKQKLHEKINSLKNNMPQTDVGSAVAKHNIAKLYANTLQTRITLLKGKTPNELTPNIKKEIELTKNELTDTRKTIRIIEKDFPALRRKNS